MRHNSAENMLGQRGHPIAYIGQPSRWRIVPPHMLR